MPRRFYQTPGAHQLVPASAMRAPLRGLSCPDGSRGVAGRRDESSQLHRNFRSFGPNGRQGSNQRSTMAADPWHWCDTLTTDYWNPPTSESQHLRQRILAAIVAAILAAILVQVW